VSICGFQLFSLNGHTFHENVLNAESIGIFTIFGCGLFRFLAQAWPGFQKRTCALVNANYLIGVDFGRRIYES
jgi:hypothetical protein